MGYESRFYIVRKSDYLMNDDSTMYYASMIAEFNMGKVYSISDIARTYPNTDCYFYADDGNTEVTKDMYGDKLKEIPIKDLIKMVEFAIRKDGEDYHYLAFLEMLKGFDEYNIYGLVALHYGY